MKPYNKQVSTDSYYLKLSNELKTAILDSENNLGLLIHLGIDKVGDLACFLASYLEDVVSDTQIWNTFVRLHREMYGKHLPFYDVDAYYEEGEINRQDICFLLWYFTDCAKEDFAVSPNNDFIADLSNELITILEDAWEEAPENENLKKYYSIGEKETYFYELRNLIDNLLFGTYLFYPDTHQIIKSVEQETIAESKGDIRLENYLEEQRTSVIHTSCTRLLGLKGQEWLAEILGKEHQLSEDIRNISERIYGFFFYKGQDANHVFLEHIASERKFNLLKKSFDAHKLLTNINDIVYMNMVLWQNEWWFSGVKIIIDYDAKMVQREKEEKDPRFAAFLDHSQIEVEKYLSTLSEVFLKVNNNKQIAFLEVEEMPMLIQQIVKENNKNLKKKNNDEAFQNLLNDLNGNQDSGLLFFSPRSGVEMTLEVNSAFPTKDNPFFKEEDCEDDVFHLMCCDTISTELVNYCIDNYKDKIPYFKTKNGKSYLDNLDFMLRYWKRENYYTKPYLIQ